MDDAIRAGDRSNCTSGAPTSNLALKRNEFSVHTGTITHILPPFCTRYRAAFHRPVSRGIHELRLMLALVAILASVSAANEKEFPGNHTWMDLLHAIHQVGSRPLASLRTYSSNILSTMAGSTSARFLCCSGSV